MSHEFAFVYRLCGCIALFAYNFLVARVDSIANEMESFIQDFTVNLEK